jgi:predicted phage tail protein
VTGPGQCTNAFFGNDPLDGTVKECQMQSPAPGATGSAAISWSMPTSNADGTALTDIAGYRVFYGTNPGSLSNVVNVAGASSTSTSVTGLAAGTYYFAVATVNSSGVQSVASNVASKVVQ